MADDNSMPDTSATASAFQSGFAKAGGGKQQKKPKIEKAPAEAPKNAAAPFFNPGKLDMGKMGLVNPFGGMGAAAPHAKRGGRVTKTGYVMLHQGETVFPAKTKSRKKAAGRKSAARKA